MSKRSRRTAPLLLALACCLAFVRCAVSAELSADASIRNGAINLGDGVWIGLNSPLLTRGVKSSPFGTRVDPFEGVERAHGGIDIAAPTGAVVVASLGGRVAAIGTGDDIGKFIRIQHARGLQTVYGHLSSVNVKKGQFVSPRQPIGKVGMTGRATGPHLHFAVKRNGQFVNPEKWLVPGAVR